MDRHAATTEALLTADSRIIREAARHARELLATDATGSSAQPIDPAPARLPDRAQSIPGYQLLREIQRGGQGVVYHAVQRATRRDVALKVIPLGPATSPSEQIRFQREVQILARLRHPHVVTVHDAGATDDCLYLAMDLVSGETLDEYIARAKPSIRERVELFVRICEAVHAAHLAGVIHRDLKPANIRIDSHGAPHVLDFGLARSTLAETDASATTRMGDFVGSLPWAAPEQASGAAHEVDLRTDVYSLGVMLYVLLTGQYPYTINGHVRDVIDNITRVEPITPRRHDPRIDSDLATITLKCLAKQRERRYQIAGELAADLRRWLAGQPIQARSDHALYLLWKLARRHRGRAALAAALLCAGCVLGVVMTALYFQAAETARSAQEETDRIKKVLNVSADVEDINSERIAIGGDAMMTYFLIGPKAEAAPPSGFRVLVILPGGDGSADFNNFARRIWKNALTEQYLLVELVAPQWSKEQFQKIVWPTNSNRWKEMKFSTEEFIHRAIDDVATRRKIDRSHVYAMGWSSGGPPVYAAFLAEKSPLTGAIAAMSIFVRRDLPPLENGRTRSIAILQSPDDEVVSPEYAQRAADTLREAGARVQLTPLSGGHGWHGDVYGTIRRAVEWLDAQQASQPSTKE